MREARVGCGSGEQCGRHTDLQDNRQWLRTCTSRFSPFEPNDNNRMMNDRRDKPTRVKTHVFKQFVAKRWF